MSERITKIAQKQSSGEFIQYPIGADGVNVILEDGTDLETAIKNILEEMANLDMQWEGIDDGTEPLSWKGIEEEEKE